MGGYHRFGGILLEISVDDVCSPANRSAGSADCGVAGMLHVASCSHMPSRHGEMAAPPSADSVIKIILTVTIKNVYLKNSQLRLSKLKHLYLFFHDY